MSGTMMVVVIVAIALAAGGLEALLKHREKMAKVAAQRGDSQTANRIAALEDRVRTLERIVTDRGHNLRDEIDSL
ncbi:hypothetical protein EV659_102256 [Rhodothalassium salexigens DSM 2132]|uniref:Phage shock protein B n=1 Tax=Rhodothalassium salexigens DSM 2132 TaxID=1188247 RepID=A0A4R2PSB8_RHOSA|nr:hypothetical protein [Rhodothalassium salexigens]MBB4210595.1 hypothetical protein [Rhodothalassium salexigens DSM 2132]MBK1639721.1 hypothetical protein [Rhodothalassium salexigens DSM 2132]TCP37848.1 hypothetical protein EV659_102256 [Rhodothalassium salexigens DSM 2132]